MSGRPSLVPTRLVGDNSNAPASTAFVTAAIAAGAGGGLVYNVKTYGAVGDGVHDDNAAINAAFTAAGSQGGIIYFPPGTYLTSALLILPSNVIIQGAGQDATKLTCPAAVALMATQMLMAGGNPPVAGTYTDYAINPVVLGTNTITTTTATDASHFTAGQWIWITGPAYGTDSNYPGWMTTVVSANSSTGVITLNENLPFGPGSGVSRVAGIQTLPRNVTVRDLTIIVPNTNYGLGLYGGWNLNVERVRFYNAAGMGNALIIGQARYGTVRNCILENACSLEVFISSDVIVDGNTMYNSGIVLDGAPFNCTVSNNHIYDPMSFGGGTDGFTARPFHGIWSDTYSQRNTFIGNVIVGVPAGFVGIYLQEPTGEGGYHIVIGNRISGAGTPATASTAGINGSATVCVGNHINNVNTALQLNTADPRQDCFIWGNTYLNYTHNYTGDGEFSGGFPYRFTQQTGIMTLTNPSGVVSGINGGCFYKLSNATPQTITNFTGSTIDIGDEIILYFNDGNTTLSSSNLILAATLNPPAGTIVVLRCFLGNPYWVEVSRSVYGTLGSTVTQATSKATAVTINTPTGRITTASDALAANTTVGFTVNNTYVQGSGNVIALNIQNSPSYGTYQAWVDYVTFGQFHISIRNITAGSLSEAISLNYAIIKAVPV